MIIVCVLVPLPQRLCLCLLPCCVLLRLPFVVSAILLSHLPCFIIFRMWGEVRVTRRNNFQPHQNNEMKWVKGTRTNFEPLLQQPSVHVPLLCALLPPPPRSSLGDTSSNSHSPQKSSWEHHFQKQKSFYYIVGQHRRFSRRLRASVLTLSCCASPGMVLLQL